MKITIEGAQRAPRWETLQNVVRDTMKDDSFRMVSVQRKNPGICYSDTGRYDVTYKGNDDARVVVDLYVSGQERGEDRG